MFDLKKEFEAAMQNDGSLSYESGFSLVSQAEDIVEAVIAEADRDETILMYESAIADFNKIQVGFDAMANIETAVAVAKNAIDNGTVSYETAVAVSANIEKELGKISATMADYMEETVSLESAHDHPAETVRRIIAAFDTDDMTFESAEDGKGFMDKAKDYAGQAKDYVKGKYEGAKVYTAAKYAQFKAWVVALYKKVSTILKDAYLKVMNFFSTDGRTIDRLIAECDKVSDKIREGKSLTQKDFKSSFPYLENHDPKTITSILDAMTNSGDGMVTLARDLYKFAFTDGFTDAKMKAIAAGIKNSVSQKMSRVPGTDRKVLVLSYVGAEIKALVFRADDLFQVESFKGTEQSLTKTITPLPVAKIKENLGKLKSENTKILTVLKKFPAEMKKLQGVAPKESIGFKQLTAGTNAIAQYSAGTLKTIKAFIALNAKHLSVYERN